MRFTDAHHHLWDLAHCHYPWLMAKGVTRFFGDPEPIQHNYLPTDFLGESPQWQPSKSVHIQVGAEEQQQLRESQWLQSLSDESTANDIPNAIVAFTDLSAANAQDQLDRHSGVSNIRGIRQIVGRHPVEDAATGTDSLLHDNRWRAGLSLLNRFGLSFDLQLIPEQYEQAFRVFSTLPGLSVAICHCGSPWYQDADGFDFWRDGMQRFARLPNVYCKVSGLGMFNHDWTVDSIKPIVLETIEIFGTNRVMFGSNFPVDKLYGPYERIWNAYAQLTDSFTEGEQQNLFNNNAERFYRI